MGSGDRDEQRLQRLAEGLVDSILEAPPADVDDELRAAGEDPDTAEGEARRVVLAAVERRRRERRQQARAEYEAHMASRVDVSVELPDTPEGRRELFAAVLQRNPGFGQMLTVQFRDLESLPDEDVASCLRQLGELGVLDDFSK